MFRMRGGYNFRWTWNPAYTLLEADAVDLVGRG
jgi:hypothetical protein